MKKLFLLDAYALIYRAYFALNKNPRINSKGLNTSAIMGFLNTLYEVLKNENPTHIGVAFDLGEPIRRTENFAEYKANREETPPDIKISVPYIKEIIKAFNIPIFECAGYEADDIIGTLSKKAEKEGFTTFMMTPDKDFGQLVSDNIFIYKPAKGGEPAKVLGVKEVCEKFGIARSEQVIDILGLWGDASDNIPGIPGIGEKTASKLIAEYESVENLIANADKLKGKMREKIEQNAEAARLSYELVTIRRDVPVELKLEDCKIKDFDTRALGEILKKLEFKELARKLCGSQPSDADLGELFAAAAPAADENTEGEVQMDLFALPQLTDINSTPHQYHLVNTPEARAALAARMEQAPRWAFDTETTGLDPLMDKMLGFSVAIDEHEAYYIPAAEEGWLDCFAPAFAGSAEKIGLNAKFDIQVLHQAGLVVNGPFFDCMLAHSALYPELRHGMDEMAEALLQYKTIHLEDIAGKGKNMDTAAVPVGTMAEYAAEDADVTLRLYHVLQPQLVEAGQEELMRRIEFPLVPVLAGIEEEGMRVEPELLQKSSDELGAQIEAIRARIDAQVGRPINLNSPRQLGELLFDEMKLLAKPKKTRTGQYVTDEETLRKLVPLSPLVADILEYREMSKLKGTYLDALPRFISPRDGRIHSTLLQMVTATGRLASQNPNLQNIPVRSEAGKLIRRAFVARDAQHSILSADYSQVELRLMAALSGDPGMIAAFTSGRDIHAETAARIYGVPHEEVTADMRRKAKTVNFGIIYGISAFGLSQRLDCPRGEAAGLIESYFAQFPGVKECMDKLVTEARERGYAETLCGRRRKLPDLNSANFNLRAAAERTAINTPIQGSAADMIKIAMVRVAGLLQGRRSRLIMQIHDELLIDLHQDEHDLIPQITEAMRSALPLPHGVPLEVEANTAPNWLEAH